MWERFAPEEQVALAFASCTYGLMVLISFIKVFPYERAMHRQGDAGLTPEQRAQRRKRRKPFLLLLATGSGIAGLWWLPQHSFADSEVNSYALLTCLLLAVLPSLVVLKKLIARLPSMLRTLRPAVPEQPFIVQWCQPVPKHAAVAAQIHTQIPDYCKTLLSSAQPGEQQEAAMPAHHTLHAVADVATTPS